MIIYDMEKSYKSLQNFDMSKNAVLMRMLRREVNVGENQAYGYSCEAQPPSGVRTGMNSLGSGPKETLEESVASASSARITMMAPSMPDCLSNGPR